MININNRVGIEGNFLHVMRGAYEKPTAHVMANGEEMPAAVRPRSGRMTALLSPVPVTVVLVLARTSKQQKEIQSSRWERRKTVSAHR